MKILHIITGFYPAWAYGGQVRVAYEICKELSSHHHVSVFTTDVYNNTSRLIYVDNPEIVNKIQIYRFKNLSNTLANKRIHLPMNYISSLKNELKKYDIIHIHGMRSTLHIPLYYFLKKYKIPYVMQAHGSLPINLGKGYLKKFYDLLWGKSLLKNAAMNLALTETEREYYLQLGASEENICYLPNGINLSEFEKLPNKGSFRKKYGISSDEKIVLYVGRLNKLKGIDLLIESFENLFSKMNNIKLVIIGPDDGYEFALKKLLINKNISQNVLFVGFLTNEEKISSYIDADVFVSPKFSGFPITFVEACACGLPIVTTKCGDNISWLHNNVGLVVNYDSPSLCEAMFNILNDYGMRLKMGQEGKKIVREYYNWISIVKQLETIYEKIIIKS